MKKRIKDYINFSSFLEGKRYMTSVDLITETIHIMEKDETIFKGSIKEFKELEKIKTSQLDKVYSSLLKMSDELMGILTKA